MPLRPNHIDLARVTPFSKSLSRSNLSTSHIRNASRVARRVAARNALIEEHEVPADAPKTASSWERAPAVPPKKGYWKTTVLLVWVGGPLVRVLLERYSELMLLSSTRCIRGLHGILRRYRGMNLAIDQGLRDSEDAFGQGIIQCPHLLINVGSSGSSCTIHEVEEDNLN